MSMNYASVKALLASESLTLEAQDRDKALARPVRYSGPGWYSLASDERYIRGAIPTFSRIRLVAADDSGDPTSVEYRPSRDTLAMARSAGAMI